MSDDTGEVGTPSAVSTASAPTVTPARVAAVVTQTRVQDDADSGSPIAYSGALDAARAARGELPARIEPSTLGTKYQTGEWAGLPHYECPYCSRFAKVNAGDEAVIEHIQRAHPEVNIDG